MYKQVGIAGLTGKRRRHLDRLQGVGGWIGIDQAGDVGDLMSGRHFWPSPLCLASVGLGQMLAGWVAPLPPLGLGGQAEAVATAELGAAALAFEPGSATCSFSMEDFIDKT